MAGRLGLEPRYSGPKPDVLPLDDLPIEARISFSYIKIKQNTQPLWGWGFAQVSVEIHPQVFHDPPEPEVIWQLGGVWNMGHWFS